MTVVARVADAHKVYRTGSSTVRALDGVSLEIEHGEFLAIKGPSGSGKSTLLHLLGGLDVPDSGTVEVNGTSLAAMTDDQRANFRRRSVGFVFQAFNLMPALSAWENVALPLLLDRTDRGAAKRQAVAALEQVGLADRLNHRPSEMSGGESQRVAVARALVADPALILADEPTGNLDSASAEDVLTVLRKAASERTGSLIMVTHDDGIASIADRVLNVRDGREVK